jgi:hypothetical protein
MRVFQNARPTRATFIVVRLTWLVLGHNRDRYGAGDQGYPKREIRGRALPVRGVRVEAFFGARGFELVVFGSVLVNVVGLQRSENEPS